MFVTIQVYEINININRGWEWRRCQMARDLMMKRSQKDGNRRERLQVAGE